MTKPTSNPICREVFAITKDMKKLPLCDCGKEGFKPITNGYICKRCYDIEKSMYKDSRKGNLFRYLNVYDRSGHKELGKFSLS